MYRGKEDEDPSFRQGEVRGDLRFGPVFRVLYRTGGWVVTTGRRLWGTSVGYLSPGYSKTPLLSSRQMSIVVTKGRVFKKNKIWRGVKFVKRIIEDGSLFLIIVPCYIL